MSQKREIAELMQLLKILDSRERVSDFSLDFREIRPLAGFGARREAVLRGEDNAWTPDLGVFDNSKR